MDSECGATWNAVREVRDSPIRLEHDEARGEVKGYYKRSSSPAPGITRKARKA